MVDISKPRAAENKVDWWHIGVTAAKHLTSAVAVMAVVFTIARPHAEEFIADTVNERINQLEMQMNDVQHGVSQAQRQQDIMQNDIDHILKTQEDTKINTRMILNSLQGMRTEMRSSP